MVFTVKVVKYCRGCNRTFEVDRTFGDNFVEKTADGLRYHPVVDCDDRESLWKESGHL